MNQPLLVLDSHYLAHRAFHAAGRLSHKGSATGVIFGFLKSIAGFKDQFDTDRVAFCFEHPHLFRRDVFPDYKIKRISKELTKQEAKDRIMFRRQIEDLRERLLPKIGFKNVFCFEGMESDDIMAAIARDMPQDEEAILITSDADLFQCLRPNVSIYSPQKQKLLTETWFVREYGIRPHTWAKVKAMAGCSGDGVPGIYGVGEVTALKYVRGEALHTSKAEAIAKGKAVVLRNRPLVQLPYVGCLSPNIVKDEVSEKAWREVCAELGMRSIAGRPPIAMRRAR